MVQGVKQNSNVSTLGAVAVAGRGETVGVRLRLIPAARKDFYQSASVGIDYKHYEQRVGLTEVGAAASALATSITYYPLSMRIKGDVGREDYTTDFSAALNMHLRGMGSNPQEFDNNRYNADGNFIYFRGGLSHTQKLPGRFELFGKVQGQLADQPRRQQRADGGVTGLLEIVGAIALLTPALSGLGALLLLIVDVGAFFAQVLFLHGDWIHTIVIGAILAALVYLQRDSIRGRLGM